ncbi:MAG: carbohydrate ABC transporter permease [Acutalibacteraceae bacterium]|nr:carbohydrate ABC transporter permease [Acutalibacteraceae bacterium]
MNIKLLDKILFILLIIMSAIFIFPVFIVLINSFKLKFSIASAPFLLPTKDTFTGFDNYIEGIKNTGFPTALGWSLFITVFSVLAIIVFTSMTAWYITRVKSIFNSLLYYALVFSMIVPFQMVMFTMSKTANVLRLDNPIGIIIIYLGFGAGLSVFMFSGFIKTVPLTIEEAATIDGCNTLEVFWRVVFPILKPTAITVAILNTMWIWNDYLLPYLVIGNDYKTIPIAVQYLKGGYGSVDMGAMMAMLVLSIIPVVVFYLSCQKYIIKGVASGAVKG